MLLVQLVHVGPLDEGARAVAPLRALAQPVADFVRAMSFPEMFPAEAQPAPPRSVVRSFFSDGLDEQDARDLLELLQASTAQLAAVAIRVLGGAAARVPADATAFAHRTAAADAQRLRRIRLRGGGLAPRRVGRRTPRRSAAGEDAAYVNFLGDEGAARVSAAYPGSTWERLADVKRRYDPQNVFRLNQNVPPAGRRGREFG